MMSFRDGKMYGASLLAFLCCSLFVSYHLGFSMNSEVTLSHLMLSATVVG